MKKLLVEELENLTLNLLVNSDLILGLKIKSVLRKSK